MKNISAEHIWGTIPTEEKEEMLFRAQASGMLRAFVFILLTISVSLGSGQYWLIILGILASVIIMPSFAEKQWRVQKPVRIIKYLAARSVARRYAYGYGLKRLEIQQVMRGYIQEVLDKSLQEADVRTTKPLIFINGTLSEKKEVWICLLQSGLVVMSEKLGGAKLEFISNFDKGVDSNYLPEGTFDTDNSPIPNALVFSGNVKTKTKIVILSIGKISSVFPLPPCQLIM